MQEGLGPAITLDGPPCSSGAYRETRICQNLAPNARMQHNFSQLLIPTLTINKRLIHANIQHWKTQLNTIHISRETSRPTPPTLLPHLALPKLNRLPNSHAFCLKQGVPGPGLMHFNNKHTTRTQRHNPGTPHWAPKRSHRITRPLRSTKTPRYRTIHGCQYPIMAHKTNTTCQHNTQDNQRPPNRKQRNKRG